MQKTSLINDQYVIADGTLLSYKSTDIAQTTLRIPSQVDGVLIRRIGSGAVNMNRMCSCTVDEGVQELDARAFMQCRSLETIDLPASMEKIQENAFDDCPKLVEMSMGSLVFPLNKNLQTLFSNTPPECRKFTFHAVVPESMYHNLLESTPPSTSGFRIVTAQNWPELASELTRITCSAATACWNIPEYADILYCIEHSQLAPNGLNAFIFTADAFEGGRTTWKYLLFGMDEDPSSELTGFRAFLRNHGSIHEESNIEEVLDWHIRADKPIPIDGQMTTLLGFYLNESEEKDGSVHVKIHARKGYVFCPSAQRVRYSGKDYYVYRRHYLTSNQKMPIARRDMAIFDDNDMIRDRELAEDIYAKYKFLAVL